MKKKKEKPNLTLIRITIESRDKIRELAEQTGLKQITVLEYLIKGKIKPII